MGRRRDIARAHQATADALTASVSAAISLAEQRDKAQSELAARSRELNDARLRIIDLERHVAGLTKEVNGRGDRIRELRGADVARAERHRARHQSAAMRADELQAELDAVRSRGTLAELARWRAALRSVQIDSWRTIADLRWRLREADAVIEALDAGEPLPPAEAAGVLVIPDENDVDLRWLTDQLSESLADTGWPTPEVITQSEARHRGLIPQDPQETP